MPYNMKQKKAMKAEMSRRQLEKEKPKDSKLASFSRKMKK